MLMKKLLPLSSLALLVVLGGCKVPFFGNCTSCTTDKHAAETTDVAAGAEKKAVEHISADDLKEKMHKHGHNTMVVNVLDEEHFSESHIKGSINVPLTELKEAAAAWDKEKEIVVYCASTECSLSAQAYHLLKDMGFEHVRAFEGGMKEWKEKGFSVEGAVEHDDLKK